jgi:8-hydroxy-5-deazaflavin:NADPH oxidoreductase
VSIPDRKECPMHVAFIGSGKIGATLARRFAETGHDVTLANSRGPESLADLVAEIGPRAHAAAGVAAAAEAGEVIVLAMPFFLYDQLPPRAFAGRIVVDATNYYPERDGDIPALLDDSTTSSELVAAHLAGAHVVKAFNTMVWTQLAADGRPGGDRDRLLHFVAGDDTDAKATVQALADDIGFDSIDHGGLAAGRAQQPGSAVFGVPLTLAQAGATS